ncbi:hypothetical protein [Chamaesiphon sp. VAR_69_metabat_338]|uniref:hypothetical protein n=1 Tax=Chamaesiphon sp. VAR_69_metabat_338 TaxID=2964704 RepID=UPI00286EAFDA|nr:hypothetical protein [Chamaesiphon sp. VAR_69_metabat_338]
MNNTSFDNFFRDSNGEIVIAQPPNIPILVWFAASLLQLLYKTGQINLGLDILATGSLLVWAILELFQGVNYFRRSLGAIVLVWILVSKIQQFSGNSLAS